MLRKFLDKIEPHFIGKGKLKKFYPFYEMMDTFLYTPKETASGKVHVRDNIDLKRIMFRVAIALTPCILFGVYNVGYQANMAMASLGLSSAPGWRGALLEALSLGYYPASIIDCFVHGFLYFMPIFLVVNIVGGICEAIFSFIRGHEINEGFLVTGMLFPLTLPPTIPLWQAAIGIVFGVIFGKEVFGGTGKNFLNPALTGRAFLYFAYPAQITGERIWVAVDGFSGATPLALGASGGMDAVLSNFSFLDVFLGLLPGSIGEGSVLFCLVGAIILIFSGIGSWSIMFASILGAAATAFLLHSIGSDSNPMFSMPVHWHLATGGLAFGIVFMATDPVSAAMTNTGKWIYGIFIGFMIVLIRVINPAFPEGVMLAILFGNTFAPLIDYYVVQANVKRRELRSAS